MIETLLAVGVILLVATGIGLFILYAVETDEVPGHWLHKERHLFQKDTTTDE